MDKKAKKILFSTFWKGGWIDNGYKQLSTADFEYAKSKGLMFDPFSITHDECIQCIDDLIKSVSLQKIVQGFLSSLSTHYSHWRSALASYVLAQKVAPHAYMAKPSGTFYDQGQPVSHSFICQKCNDVGLSCTSEAMQNQDLNVLNFERIKWGGIRQTNILYILFDLQQFQKDDIPEPKAQDLTLFQDILDTIASSAPDDNCTTLEKRFARVLPSSKSERQILIQTLAISGILTSANQDGQNRTYRGGEFMTFAGFWRGADQYNLDAVRAYFGRYVDV